MVVALATGLLSWALYPTGVAPSRPSPVFVSVGSTLQLLGVQVTISQPLGTDYYEIDVTGTSPERTTPTTDPAAVWISLAGDLLLATAQHSVSCSPSCYAMNNEFGQGVSLFRFRAEFQPRWSIAASGSTFTSWIRLPKSALALDSGGIKDPSVQLPGMICGAISCRGSVPVVTATATTPTSEGAYGYVRFDDVALQGFEWSSPLTPYAQVEPGLLFNYPLGKDSTSHFTTEYPADGENAEQQRWEQFRLFLSGAVVALSGGLLIAALQETIQILRSRGAQA